MARYIIIFLIAICCTVLSAQSAKDMNNLSWVRLMHNDTTVNFFTARKDYSIFKSQHRNEEVESRSDQVNNTERAPEEEHLENPQEAVMMAFEKWVESIKPFVSSDGKIMPVEQRMAMMGNKKE